MNNHSQFEKQRLQASREELVGRIAQTMQEDGVLEVLPGLHLGRLSAPNERIYSVLEPSLCVIAQGSKVVFLGQTQYQYDPFNYLLTTLELPRVSQVIEASRTHPYLSFRLELDPALVSSVMVEAEVASGPSADISATAVSPMDTNLLDAVVRFIRLIDSPDEARIMIPLITREIIYRLLMGDQRGRLCHLTGSGGGNTSSIVKAVARLREDFDKSIRMENLAEELGMSVSSFHHHFKSVTAMSPLQFQKRLRLQEARRLMVSEDLDATSAAYRVGYNDAAHFNKEYKSLFGQPPMRDVQRLRESTVG